MRKNAKKMIVMLLLAVVACGSYFISSTYAKYSRKFSGEDTATVAKFSVLLNEKDKNSAVVIDLFGTVKEVDGEATEEHVLEDKIAPGTGGKFDVKLTNDSEVDVKAVITLTEKTNPGVPIEYSVDGTTWKKVDATTKTVTFDEVTLDHVGSSKASPKLTDTVTVQWRWAFEGSESTNFTATQTDTTDTEFGEATSAAQVKTEVSVVFTQIN